MKRIAVVLLLLLTGALAGIRTSHADDGGTSSVCGIDTAGNPLICTNTPVPTAGPPPPTVETPGPPPVVSSVLPIKTMAVSQGVAGPNGISEYFVTLTSEVACFALTEPINVSVIGNPSAAALSVLAPAGEPTNGSFLTVHVDPVTSTATLSLEVLDKGVGAGGISVQAVWPDEHVSILQNVVPAPPPTATPTLPPGQPTPVPPPTDTPTPTATPGETPTATPTSTPVPPPFGVRACLDPTVVNGTSVDKNGSSITLYGLTTPGAVCTGAVTYYHAYGFAFYGDQFVDAITQPSPSEQFDGSPQTANAGGIAEFDWTEQTTASFGTGTVTCALPGLAPQSSCAAFLIKQTDTAAYIDSLSADARSALLRTLAADQCPPGSAPGPSA